MKKNKKKKNTITKKQYIVFLFLILCCATLVIVLNRNRFYKIEDRTSNIKEEKKIDLDMIKTVGWIKVQGTTIDEPIIYYSMDFDSETDTEGKERFAFTEEPDEVLHNRVYIVGHNILNLSKHPQINKKTFTRFEDLMSFVYYDFAKKNKYIQYTVDNKNYLYKIYAVRLYKDYIDIENDPEIVYSEKEIKKNSQEAIKDSIYKYNVKVTGKDNIITLVTCTRFFGADKHSALIVDARMLRKGEITKNYSVKKTDNYKKVEKILKGDEGNES